ncbi:glutamate--tRNA ligase [Longimicrobium sp.]|uniref:glutamate--tRNA ligase n=1 Tax=Longimicrobium sp. TaxID=2029185 RepID=UPI002E380764|nr:glutamate--tRNA ligase [Longimicrobium sp.]HEX6036508.1 glutamate--tRNA ligase [Longimicrobium sp.]
MSDPIRVRFAPSPTGYLHLGGARTALFNWLIARKLGGVFVLRIEDTDRERSTDESTQTILDGMKWMGLTWDEGPFHQADGFDRHKAEARRLLAEGKAYRCFCTAEELAAKKAAVGDEYRYDQKCRAIPPAESDARADAGEPHTIRFRVPEGTTAWDDVVHGETRFDNASIDDFIILRTDGTPIYNMAVVSDDIDMRITHVIRGDDHIPNTPKQILLYQALGAPVPAFAHLPMILGPDGKKLSKRHGATAVGDYADEGFLPEALFNFIAFLGWNPGDEREVMDRDELVQAFSLERINKKGAIFDREKLAWMNGRYLEKKPAEELLPIAAPLLVTEGLISQADVETRRDWLLHLLELIKVRVRKTTEIPAQARVYLTDEVFYDPGAVEKQWKDPATSERLGAVRDALRAVEPWTLEGIEGALRAAAEGLGVGFGKVAQPLRVALTGSAASPGIDHVVYLLGRDRALARIDHARERIGAGTAA